MKPIVAIIGRTNVGKSTLFNHLARRRIAIIEDEPGVTRDRLYCDVEHDGVVFTAIDTGGLVDAPLEELRGPIATQTIEAMREADVLVFMVDGLAGLTAADRDVADIVRVADKPTVLAINKIESPKRTDEFEFSALGFKHSVAVSAKARQNIAYLLDEVVSLLRVSPPDGEPEAEMAYDFAAAIVGRPNVGKSSLLNLLLGMERSIVSDLPGTTRDSIDSILEHNGTRVLLTDTAGMRKKARVNEDLEYYCVVRALRSIDRSDLVLLIVDAGDGITEQDQRIAGYAHEAGKLVMVLVNKFDLLTDPVEAPLDLPYHLEDPMTPAEAAKHSKTLQADWKRSVRDRLIFLDYAPLLFVSALKRRGIKGILPAMMHAIGQYRIHISTPSLNRLMMDAAAEHPAPARRGRRLRIYYATQADTAPPTIVLFVNDPELVHFSYERYLRNRVREAFSLTGTPIRLVFRARTRTDPRLPDVAAAGGRRKESGGGVVKPHPKSRQKRGASGRSASGPKKRGKA